MSQSTALLSLPLIQEAQAQKHVTHNEALLVLDGLVQPVALDLDRTEPPEGAAEGDRHVVAAGATGDWAGRDGALARFAQNGWVFYVPQAGWRVRVLAEGADAVFDGSTWRVEAGGTGGGGTDPNPSVETLGVNAGADAANRLTVSSAGTLLTHEGDDHRLAVNKAAAGDTASLLFQTGWSGRAEMGLAGDDGFSVRVSADGTDWTTALRLDPATGAATGEAVQQAPDDVTAGRLMRADWGYGPGNLLAPVALSGGVPTGGVLERGENADGTWLRLADGTLICTGRLILNQVSGAELAADWTFPVSFAGAPDSVAGSVDPDEAGGTTPALEAFGALVHGGLTASGVRFRQARVAGTVDFAPGDTVACGVTAIGRWV